MNGKTEKDVQELVTFWRGRYNDLIESVAAAANGEEVNTTDNREYPFSNGAKALIEKVGSASAEVKKQTLQEKIHVDTIRDLQAAALQYLTYPHDGERQGLESAVKASLCIVPLEHDSGKP